jgi:2-keto-4-pentenoate hydratase
MNPLTADDIQLQAERLYTARSTREPIPPLSRELPDLTVADAYAIQSALVRLLQGERGQVVGYKLGLTSKPMQEMLGVSEPDYGPILDCMVQGVGVALDRGGFIQPKIEAELALHLRHDLIGPGVTRDRARNAVSGVSLAVEVIDSRIEDWKISLTDTVADLASGAAVYLSPRIVPLGDLDLRLVGVVVSRNGQLMATGAGAAALGDPLEAVAWLANTLAAYGERLQAGRFVMTGSLHAAFPLTAGDEISVETDPLGSLVVRIA